MPVPDVRPVLAWRALRALLPRGGKRELRACGRAVWGECRALVPC